MLHEEGRRTTDDRRPLTAPDERRNAPTVGASGEGASMSGRRGIFHRTPEPSTHTHSALKVKRELGARAWVPESTYLCEVRPTKAYLEE